MVTVQQKERPLSEQNVFTKNKVVKNDIDQDNLIRRLTLLLTVTMSTAAAMTAATLPRENGLVSLVKKIKVIMDTDENKFDVDAFKMRVVEAIEKGAPQFEDTLAAPAAGTSNTLRALITLDFAQQRQNLRDLSALLNAPNLTSLKFSVDWGDETNLFGLVSDTVIDSATIDFTVVEVFDRDTTPDNLTSEQRDSFKKGIAPKGFIDLREGIDVFDVTKQHNSYDNNTLKQDVDPDPSTIFTHLFVAVEDSTEVSGQFTRANDIITDIKVDNVKGNGEILYQSPFFPAHFTAKGEYAQENIFTGAVYIDWRDQRRGGLANFVKDALKFKFLTNAPIATETDQIELFTRYASGVQ